MCEKKKKLARIAALVYDRVWEFVQMHNTFIIDNTHTENSIEHRILNINFSLRLYANKNASYKNDATINTYRISCVRYHALRSFSFDFISVAFFLNFLFHFFHLFSRIFWMHHFIAHRSFVRYLLCWACACGINMQGCCGSTEFRLNTTFLVNVVFHI